MNTYKFVMPERAEIEVYDCGPYTEPRTLKGPEFILGDAIIDNRRIWSNVVIDFDLGIA